MNAHSDMSSVIIPRSDQINADDLIAGPMTITIRDVQIKGGQEQPVSIYFDGSDKAYRPCKSMSRVLVQAWGADAKAYIGRSLTLYRDPTVKWGGLDVGGIRISHMSNIDGVKQMMLTATKGSRKPFKVMPLVAPTQPVQDDAASKWAHAYIAKLATFGDLPALNAFVAEKATKLAELSTARPDLHTQVTDALAGRTAQLSPSGFDDDLSADDDQPVEAEEKTAAEAAVEKLIAECEAATTAEVLEKLIKDAEAHKAFMPDDLQIKLEIAFDRNRHRLEAPAEAGAN